MPMTTPAFVGARLGAGLGGDFFSWSLGRPGAGALRVNQTPSASQAPFSLITHLALWVQRHPQRSTSWGVRPMRRTHKTKRVDRCARAQVGGAMTVCEFRKASTETRVQTMDVQGWLKGNGNSLIIGTGIHTGWVEEYPWSRCPAREAIPVS